MPDPFPLLVACCLPGDDADGAARIRAAVAEPHDWGRVLEAASSHGLVPLVCRRVLVVAPDVVGRTVAGRLRALALASAARALAAMQQLAAVIGRLDQAGIDALPYKGPALAADAYGDAALRACDDLDIVVVPARAEAAAAVLAAAGYAPIGAPAWADARAVQDWQGHVVFRGAREALPIELHWRFCNRKLPWSLPPDEVMARAGRLVLAGVPMRVPERHDQLVGVLLHAARHGWDRLEAMACAAALLRRGVDPPTLLERAAAAGGLRATLTGLELARRVLGTSLPAGLEDAGRVDAALPALVERAESRLRHGDAGAARDARLHLSALDGLGARLRYVALHVALPTPRDRAVMRLPRALAPLYVAVRLVRLAARAVTGRGRSGLARA